MDAGNTIWTIERADGKPMAVRRIGRGRKLVCLAGGPGRDAEYLGTLGGLDDHFELITPDARGTGSSPEPESNDGYGFDQLALDVELLRADLDTERLTLLAHSAGCTTALTYAAANPGRIASLILVTPGRRLHPEIPDDTVSILRERHHEPQIAAAVAALERLRSNPPADDVPQLLAELTPGFYGEWTARQRMHAAAEAGQVNLLARQMFGEPSVDEPTLRRRLGMVEAPVLVVTGTRDGATGVLPGAAWAACFPGGQHVAIDRAGHFPWVDRPSEFRGLVVDFLTLNT